MFKKLLLFAITYSISINSFSQTTCGTFLPNLKISPDAYNTLGVKTDGSLWSWGRNESGELGDGTYTPKSTPNQIGQGSVWGLVTTGANNTVALKSDGSLWSWGYNDYGQVGDGTIIPRMTPVQVGIDTDWKSVSVGTPATLAIKNDGSLWGWGQNYFGELGDDAPSIQTTPIQIGTATNWSSIVIARHMVGIKTDGTLWAWGGNHHGQIGNGTTIGVETPTQIGTDTWSSVALGIHHTIGIKTDGSLWGWGSNIGNMIGGGFPHVVSSPVQIGTATDWAVITGGEMHTMAIKTDGTLWGWGDNFYGQLGEGVEESYASPLQVGTDTDWYSVTAGRNHTVAVKTDGSVWSWGFNAEGQLGDGTNIHRRTPVLISSNNLITLATAHQTQTLPVNSPTVFFNSTDCDDLIAKVVPLVGQPVSGDVESKVWIETTPPVTFVKRHYEITPANNATDATGRITLYFTQSEFDEFNIGKTTLLPTSPIDVVNKSNLLIEKRPGKSNNNTGLPHTYTSGAPVTIKPVNDDIVWNATSLRWEVTFNVTGFSGFFVKTSMAILPLRWLAVNGNITSQGGAQISWTVEEFNVLRYEIEKSNDGIQYTALETINSKGDNTNSYNFLDRNNVTGTAYYRIKQIDFNGRYTYSSVIRLSNQSKKILTVYPVPFKDGFTVLSPLAQQAQLLNQQGQVVKTIQLNAGTNYVYAETLSSGIYMLKTNDGALQKVIKK